MVGFDAELLCHSAADAVEICIHGCVGGVDSDVVAYGLDDTTLLGIVATDMLRSAEEERVVADDEVAA